MIVKTSYSIKIKYATRAVSKQLRTEGHTIFTLTARMFVIAVSIFLITLARKLKNRKIRFNNITIYKFFSIKQINLI